MEIRCRKCLELFEKRDILVCTNGVFCTDCVPEDAASRVFVIHLSWLGITSLVDVLGGIANVDQMMVVDRIREKLAQKMLEAIKELMDEAKVYEPYSEPLGEGDGEYQYLSEDGEKRGEN